MEIESGILEAIQSRYEDAILQGDLGAAKSAVEDALRQGSGLLTIYSSIIAPAQVEVGERWHAGKLTIAEEHRATQVSLRVMEQMRHTLRPRYRLGVSALIACVEGETHEMGALMLSDLLHLDGWDVTYLGSSMPAHDLVEFVRQNEPILVILSATLREHLAPLKETLLGLQKLDSRPKIIVGGPAVAGVDPASLAADAVISDTGEALRVARSLGGLTTSETVLEHYLRGLGEHIQRMRKRRGWSQQELAQRAGLDRTYISTVEHGKQNLTLGAVTKLAHALDLALFDVLIERG